MIDRTLEENNARKQPQLAVSEKHGNIQIGHDAEGALTVEILPRRNRAAFKMAAITVVFGIITILVLQFVSTHPRPGQRGSSQLIDILHVLQVVEAFWVGYFVAHLYTGMQKLTLSLTKLEIRSFLLGIGTRRKSFPCSEIKDLRYDQWKVKSRNKTIEHSGIRFETDTKSHTFGAFMSAAEATEIISKVREICPAIVQQPQ